MANLTVYANQPATKGKVVLHTTIGPFDVELWSKEAPLACRNFVQLCMEGCYDGCIFHRVIKDFMAQTGDPTGTGTGGASVYEEGGPEGAGPQGIFKDEFNGRLRFIHRGLLGMASNGPHTNGSQFFVTLGNCEWLDRKHTIFGKITGNSLYNVNRFGELECDAKDLTLTSSPHPHPNPSPHPHPHPNPSPHPSPHPHPKPNSHPDQVRRQGPAHLPSEDTTYRDPARPLRRHRAAGEGGRGRRGGEAAQAEGEEEPEPALLQRGGGGGGARPGPAAEPRAE